MRDYEPYFTEDGSIGLYSYADKDVYHSKFGALTEAWEKFIIPSEIEEDIINNKNIKVLDVCFGIGYNSKALMSLAINKNLKKLKRKNIFQKFFAILKILYYIVSICAHKLFAKKKELFPSLETIYANNLQEFPHIKIDCLDMNEELIQLSPLFRTVKTPYEIYSMFVPDVFTIMGWYYALRTVFTKIITPFMPKNRKEINELLDLKFRTMHLEKEYRMNQLVNYILINKLSELYGKDYPNKEIKKIVRERYNRRFFDKDLIRYAKFNQKWGYKLSCKAHKHTFLHNIYYRHLSIRDKYIDFEAAQRLFELNFFINDARKSILEISEQYDYIFLDAFTYTKAPQLWSVEFIAELYKRMKPTGVLLTYSNSAQVRNTLLENNFYVGKIYAPNSEKVIGTIASKDKSKIKHPLNSYELGLCATKAGIPYHDPNLKFSSQEIKELREYEFKHSNLISSSRYMKLRSLKNDDK